jgi:hypothetical protein
MDESAQGAAAFSVDEAYFENPFSSAGREIFRDQLFHLLGLKGVEVQDTVNRKLHLIIFFYKHYRVIREIRANNYFQTF